MRAYVKDVLLELKFLNIAEAKNGRDALNYLNSDDEEIVHVIFCDINMPQMDGVEFVKRLRSDKKFEETVVIMVSAIEEKSILLEAIEVGANDFINKPFSAKEMEDLLQNVYDKLDI